MSSGTVSPYPRIPAPPYSGSAGNHPGAGFLDVPVIAASGEDNHTLFSPETETEVET